MLIDNECRLVRSAGSRASVERVDGVGYGGVQQGALGVPFDGLRQRVRRQSACMEMVHQLIGRRPVDGCNFRRRLLTNGMTCSPASSVLPRRPCRRGPVRSRHAVPAIRRTATHRASARAVRRSESLLRARVGCRLREVAESNALARRVRRTARACSANGRTLEDVFHVVRPWKRALSAPCRPLGRRFARIDSGLDGTDLPAHDDRDDRLRVVASSAAARSLT